eukprot:TRINITY_DN679_c2_g1_i1.p1 TRINITY_DN679_c2_g1~~TRINITY_DN679_c2_g1_i1.p1  ORF type:complete len:347 (+),score=64.46 TRINITY_DN679_c2_g1_i1:43-1041(+)
MLRKPDPAVAAAQTVSGLWDKIKKVRAEAGGKLFERSWVNAENIDEGDIRVMQFNMLAEGLSSPARKTPPFKSEKISDGGGFTEVPVDVLNFDQRKWLLLEEILTVNPDILGVEEVDAYPEFFEPALSIAGYQSGFNAKSPSPCEAFGYYPDGVALFWKSDKFELLSGGVTSSPVMIHRRLKQLSTGRALTVICTHLKAKLSVENERIRYKQIAEVLSNENISFASCVLLADCNAAPVVECGVEPLVVPAVCSKGFLPAYDLEDASAYTTAKIRGSTRTSHTIDYIFYTPNMVVTSTFAVPPFTALDPAVLLPCLNYPSDHFSIAATLRFTQ